MLVDLGLAPKAFAEDLDSQLRFGDLEPLVCELQDTPVERLQAKLAQKLKGGLPLKTLVAAGAHANARTFGGEDYIGFHTFMALGPALKMSALMPKGSEALPVFKVLYRNSNRIQEYGGRESETLHAMSASTPVNEANTAALHAAKYFYTVWDDFHATRPSARWRYMISLARVTATEFGSPAAGQAEARELLGIGT